MPATPSLPPELEALVAAYLQDMRADGCYEPHMSWAARRFCDRIGLPAKWLELPLDQQLALPIRVRAFVSWLHVTQRLSASADYLVTVPTQLGRLAGRRHPQLHATISDTARNLGYSSEQARGFWTALVKTAALFQIRPDDVDAAQLVAARTQLKQAAQRLDGHYRIRSGHGNFGGLGNVMFHAGLLPEPPHWPLLRDCDRQVHEHAWAQIPAPMAATMHRFLAQRATIVRPSTLARDDRALRHFGLFLVEHDPALERIAQLRREHIEAFKAHLATRPLLRYGNRRGNVLHKHTISNYLCALAAFFDRLTECGDDDRPPTRLLFPGDYPRPDRPLPRFLDDPSAAKLLAAARDDQDVFTRLVVELLARTGLRLGELRRLAIDAVVQIGSAYWLRVPIGKLRTDRYVPLHPDLKTLIDEWLALRGNISRHPLLFVTDRGWPISNTKIERALARTARRAGIGHVTPHQLRHTLATQAVNRGMSLDAIAALLGHRDMSMTMVYARIGDRTVADQYFAVSEKVDALYQQPKQLPASAEGSEMGKLRRQMHQRMLGNGYCARPIDMDCHFDTVCETCSFFVTTNEFRPTLEKQRDDAAHKGQIARKQLFDGLLNRLDQAS